MDHPRTELIAHLRGELSADARERVTAHLAACPACARESAAFARIAGVLRDTAPPVLEPHWGRWRAELRDTLARRRARVWWPVPLAVSAGLAGVLLAFALLGGPSRPAAGPPAGEGGGLRGPAHPPPQDALLEAARLPRDLRAV